ncbi:MAG: alpha-glucosidase/alpha-galactosidase [Bacillota bacterium]
MAKITFIGAGSIVFAKGLLVDILSFKALEGATISLMDIDPKRLDLMKHLADKIVIQEGFRASVEATTDRRKAIAGSDYVINMIQVGGLDAFRKDISIPSNYGIDQAVGDTLGPGGVFRGLRTIPVLLDILRDMEELCPDALFLNYANPMAINCWAINTASGIRNVGLCHSVQNTAKDIADYIGAPLEEVSYKCAGINHMCWFLEYKWRGRDAYPLLKEKYNNEKIYNRDIVKFEVLKHFGYFVSESSYHMSEYVSYFRKSKKWLEKIRGMDSWLKECDGSYYNQCAKLNSSFYEDMEEVLVQDKILTERTHEYAAYIINAMETGEPTVIYGNVVNNGLIDNLPGECIVEVPCLVDKNGIQPVKMGKLPPQLAALNKTNVNVQGLAVEGALSGNKDIVCQAVMMDPLTSSVLTMPEIHRMVTEMFEAEKEYLPQFK